MLTDGRTDGLMDGRTDGKSDAYIAPCYKQCDKKRMGFDPIIRKKNRENFALVLCSYCILLLSKYQLSNTSMHSYKRYSYLENVYGTSIIITPLIQPASTHWLPIIAFIVIVLLCLIIVCSSSLPLLEPWVICISWLGTFQCNFVYLFIYFFGLLYTLISIIDTKIICH